MSCDAQRPDKRGITKCIAELSPNSDASLFTLILLEGDPVEIEVTDKNSGTALRALRKLEIDYEILDKIISSIKH